MSNVPAGPVIIRCGPVGDIRRAIIISPTVNFALDNSAPVPLPVRLDHIVHTAALAEYKRQEIKNLYRLYVESDRAQQFVVQIRNGIPPASQRAAYEALGKTMRSRGGNPVQSSTYQYTTNLCPNAHVQLEERLMKPHRQCKRPS